MKALIKIAVFVLASSQAFAVTTSTLEQMNVDIQMIKADISNVCRASESQSSSQGSSASVSCQKQVRDVQKALCAKKLEMVTFFEGITSKQNIQAVAKRFGETPPADALGGVLLWQMRGSIDQVNHTWSRRVDQMKAKTAKCVSADSLKKELTDYTDYIKTSLSQTTLLVNVNQ